MVGVKGLVADRVNRQFVVVRVELKNGFCFSFFMRGLRMKKGLGQGEFEKKYKKFCVYPRGRVFVFSTLTAETSRLLLNFARRYLQCLSLESVLVGFAVVRG